MRIVGYVRVSTDEQAKSGLGLEGQQEKVRLEAERRGVLSVEFHGDPGKKGDLPLEERDGLQAAIRSLKRGDVLMVAKLDRLSRCGAADTAAIESAIKRRGARLVSASGEGTEPRDKYDIGAHMQKDVAEMFSRIEKRHISSRTHDALQAKRHRGSLAGHVPYGFTTIDAEGKTKRGSQARALVPLAEEQQAVSVIRYCRDLGMGLRKTCRELESRGLKPRGRRWHPETVRSILAQVAAHPDSYPSPRSPTGQRANVDTVKRITGGSAP